MRWWRCWVSDGIGSTVAGSGRHWWHESFDLNVESLALNSNFNGRLGKVSYFHCIPLVPDSNSECVYRHPLFPNVRDRSWSRRPYTRHGAGVDAAFVVV